MKTALQELIIIWLIIGFVIIKITEKQYIKEIESTHLYQHRVIDSLFTMQARNN